MTDTRPAWSARLETERLDRHWGKHEMARRLLIHLGITPTPDKVKNLANQIRGYENGAHYPRNWDYVFSEVLGIPYDELFPKHETALLGTVQEGSTPRQGDDNVKRRAAIHIISAIAAGTAIPPGAIETLFSGLDDSLGRPLGLSEWEATVHEYGQVVGTLPAGELIKDLIADIVAVGELLNRPNSTDDRAALMRVNAGLAGVLAVDFGDVGEKRAARMSWAAARQSADASGDRDLRVWVRGKAAQKAFWTERPDSVVAELASEAIGIADGTPSAGLADAYAARVYVAAARGDTDRVDSTLDDLRRVFDHLPQDTNDQSALAFRESQLRWAESYARTWNADPRAEVSLEHALSLYPSNAFAPRTNLALMKAAVMINDREIEAGLQHAITTMENDYRRCAGRAQLVKRVLHTLPGNARTLPAARELHAFTTAT